MRRPMNKDIIIQAEVNVVKKKEAEGGLEGAWGEVVWGDHSEDLTSLGPF